MDAKRGALKRGKYTSILDRWQNDEVYRESQLVHGWTEEWVKYFDYISKIDVSHDAPYRQRLRCGKHRLHERRRFQYTSRTTVSTTWLFNHQQILLSAFNELKAKEYLRFRCICEQDIITHWIPQSNNAWSGWVSTGRRISRRLQNRKPNVVEFFILGVSKHEDLSQIINIWRRFFKICKRSNEDSCLRQWKQPCILDQIIQRIWKYTRTRTSRKFKVCSRSHRNWYWNILRRFCMRIQLKVHLSHGRDRHCLLIAQDQGLRFKQTNESAIIVRNLVPADCIFWVISQKGDRTLFERLSTPRLAPKVTLRRGHLQQQQPLSGFVS